jgi:hypothetical protein
MRYILIPVLLLLINTDSVAQKSMEWFPSNLNIQPFTAHFLEPKAGFQYLFDLEKVRIDIGTSHDIIHWLNESESFSLGADFFTYTRARSENNFKFPVETVDYLFGINGSYKYKIDEGELGVRLRFSHISAHLVDGYYNAESESWLNGREPFVYSREFFELIAYYKVSDLRVYGGVTYNIHIVPDEIKKEIFQVGFDYYPDILSTSVLTPFVAYDFKLTGIDEYSGNSIISAGIKFGKPESRGFTILASYFSGKSVHGEFYDISENYATIGINLDL